MLLNGKVVLVTGGSRGLGRADALALAEAGAEVVIADILDTEKTVNDLIFDTSDCNDYIRLHRL